MCFAYINLFSQLNTFALQSLVVISHHFFPVSYSIRFSSRLGISIIMQSANMIRLLVLNVLHILRCVLSLIEMCITKFAGKSNRKVSEIEMYVCVLPWPRDGNAVN